MSISSAELWIIASTFIFFALIWRPASRALLGGLDVRRDRVAGELNEAQRLREEAERLLITATARHLSAEKEAQDILAFARDEAARLRQQAEINLKENLERREKQALDRIQQAEETALRDVTARSIDLAIQAASLTIGEHLSGKAGDKLIEEAIIELPYQLGASST